MTQYRIVHTTEYRFDRDVRDFHLTVRLEPMKSCRQQCDFFQMVARPTIQKQKRHTDSFGNGVWALFIPHSLQRLTLSAISTVTVGLSSSKRKKDPEEILDERLIKPTALVPINEEIFSFGHSVLKTEKSAQNAAMVLGRHIYSHFDFASGVTGVSTDAAAVLKCRSGVCQDFAHLAIAVLRAHGLPARYVSGYLNTAHLRGKSHRIAADASHAWFEVYDRDHGWVGFDPANGCRVDHNYIVVARGADYNDVCPLQGAYEGGGAHRLMVSVDVQQIYNGQNTIT